MPTIEPRVIPDDYYSFSLKDLNTLVTALERFMDKKEVMRQQDAANFLGISYSKLRRLDNIPSHKVPGLAGRIYLKSELIEYIKRH